MSAGYSRAEPLPATLTVREARDAYLQENGFTVEAYEASWTPASLFGIPFSVPNTAKHRVAIMWHDLHHVATGFGTDLAGEAEISAWEARNGLRGVGLYVTFLVVGLAKLGLLVAPRRTVRAWGEARGGRNLFRSKLTYEEVLALTVGELRALLGVPERGLATGIRELHSRAPG